MGFGVWGLGFRVYRGQVGSWRDGRNRLGRWGVGGLRPPSPCPGTGAAPPTGQDTTVAGQLRTSSGVAAVGRGTLLMKSFQLDVGV